MFSISVERSDEHQLCPYVLERQARPETLFARRAYPDVIALLKNAPDPSTREQFLLGAAYLRTGEAARAESLLLAASERGDPDAQASYGNLLRVTGQHARAKAHLQAVLPRLSGESALAAERWLGLTLLRLGERGLGRAHLERAWRAHLERGEEELAAHVAQHLADADVQEGQPERALSWLRSALGTLRGEGNANFRALALRSLAGVLVKLNRPHEARAALSEARALAETLGEARALGYVLVGEADLARAQGDAEGAGRALGQLEALLGASVEYSGEYDLQRALAFAHAETLSGAGRHACARAVLTGFQARFGGGPGLTVRRAVLARREGDLGAAEELLLRALAALSQGQGGALPALARLQLALVRLLRGEREAALQIVRAHLEDVLALGGRREGARELGDFAPLFRCAAREADLAPLLQPLLEHCAPPPEAPARLRLRLRTFGEVRAWRVGEASSGRVPLAFALRGSPVLLAYLALRPGRTRAEIERDLLPARGDKAGSYVRGALRELREVLGADVIVREGPHRESTYRLADHVALDLDVPSFFAALEAGDVARALALYGGPFCALWEDGGWVARERERAHHALLAALARQLEDARAGGEWRRAVLLCNQLLQLNPKCPHTHAARLEAARRAASPKERASYAAQFERLSG